MKLVELKEISKKLEKASKAGKSIDLRVLCFNAHVAIERLALEADVYQGWAEQFEKTTEE